MSWGKSPHIPEPRVWHLYETSGCAGGSPGVPGALLSVWVTVLPQTHSPPLPALGLGGAVLWTSCLGQ